ncbi:MAG: hypothetical protein PS018_07390, partial [bacterium]|nr:hypothetical protein [bacterium]
MATEPRRALSGALHDPVRWIRLGATQLTPWLAPTGAAEILAAKAGADGASVPPEETSALAIAMTHAGGDPLPMVADFLHDTVANLEHALSGDYGQWEDYLLQRPGAKSAKVFNSIMPLYANWGSHANARLREAPAPQDPDSSRASAALYAMRHWEFLMLDSGSNSMKALAGEAFAPAVRLLEAGMAMEAVAPLVTTALTMPSDTIRVIARMTLPALGSYASATLLSALGGKPAVVPDVRAFNSQASKSGVVYPDDMTAETLAAFLAGEALERFTDTPTAFAIVNSAITWADDLKARAARVTARMAAETALPPLVWSALNLPVATERQAAAALLDRIVTSDRTLGMRLHHVGTKELVPNQLGWLTDMVTDGLQSRPWMADLSVSVPILRVALEVMPDIVGEAGFMYSEPPTATMASNFQRSVSGIRNWFDGPLAAVKQARHPEVTLPGECPPDSDVTLSVQLLLGATGTTASPIDVPFPEGKEQVDISVMIHAPGFSTSADHKTIRVPRDKPSDIATFTLHSRATGAQTVDIKFMMGTAILGQCCAVTEVKGEARHDLKADVTEIDPVGDFTQLQSSAQAVLRVKTLADGGLEWSIQKPGVPLKPLGRSTISATAAQAEALGATQRPHIKQ